MRKQVLQLWFCLSLLCFAVPSTVLSEESLSYQQLIKTGKEAIDNRDYQKAIFYFKLAHLADPSADEPRYYVNLVKRIQEGHVLSADLPVLSEPHPQEPKLSKTTTRGFQEETSQSVGQQSIEYSGVSTSAFSKKSSNPETYLPVQSSTRKTSGLPVIPRISRNPKGPLTSQEKLKLDDAFWAKQPNTLLTLDVKQSTVLEGKNIDRSLIITPGFLEVDKIDKDHMRLTGTAKGSTFLHVWDDHGRWTFRVDIIYPITYFETAQQDTLEESAPPFRFGYSADWDSYYTGGRMRDLQRQNLNFLQWTGISGETPYGDFDTSALFNKFQESTEVTGYTVGLTNGHIGNFKDFSIRGYDASKEFSPLTLPGKYFRGILLDADAFNHKLSYTVLHGLDRASFGYLSPGIIEKTDSYIEGVKMTLFPYDNHSYSLNFAQGYGAARADYLKKRTYSLETSHKFNDMLVATEIAHDEDHYAGLINTQFGPDDTRLRLNYRDIHEDFVTATSLPSDRGEVGGNVLFDMEREHFNWNSNLDVYEDRFLTNPDDPNALNYDLDTSLEQPMGKNSDVRSSFYFIDTPGEISPRRNLRLNNVYTHSFDLFRNGRMLTTYLGNTYQWSRFKFLPISDYDRDSVDTGLRLPLIRNLYYFINYEYSWVTEKDSGSKTNPSVYTTGFNYNKQLTDFWSTNMGVQYRNEEQTEGLHSFLAGEDSISGNLGFNFRPTPDFEFFVDGRLRNVWAENNDRQPYNEGDIRWGVRSSWDMPFRFNPIGEINGIVFKDLNANGIRDLGEEGIPGIKVNIGHVTATSNVRGFYTAKIRAKRATVELDVSSLPPGYIIGSELTQMVDIQNHQTQTINFALSTQSGLYGVVFADLNGNGTFDSTDEAIAKVKITLDGKDIVHSDFEGAYFFENLSPGKHTIVVDVNSIPLDYLPLIKLKNEVDIEEGTTYTFNVPLKKRNAEGNVEKGTGAKIEDRKLRSNDRRG